MVELSTEFAPVSMASISSLESLLSEPPTIEPIEKFLRFRMSRDQSLLIAVEDILGVRTISVSEILPVPHMNACVLGIYNWRGEALWLVDLIQQMGVGTLPEQVQRFSSLMTIVVQHRKKSLGLVVPEVHEIEQHNPKELLLPSADLFPQNLLPFIKGYFVQDRSIVLDVSSVLNDSSLRIHHFNSH
jgi:positive phototaxis protein PixI